MQVALGKQVAAQYSDRKRQVLLKRLIVYDMWSGVVAQTNTIVSSETNNVIKSGVVLIRHSLLNIVK